MTPWVMVVALTMVWLIVFRFTLRLGSWIAGLDTPETHRH